MPAVCKFFIKGHCRFGSNCKFLHPKPETNKTFSFTAALNETSQNYSFRAPTNSNFSFTQALEQTRNVFDVDMLDEPLLSGSIFQKPSFQGNFVDIPQQPILFSHQPHPHLQPHTQYQPQQIKQQQPSRQIEYSEAELRAYASSEFEFRKIPVRPPPENGR